MAKRVLDTNRLIDHFQRLRPLDDKGPDQAEAWARRLIQDRDTNAIVAPVEVEFLCGVLNEHERRLREAFLRPFKVIDDRKTTPKDWEEARRLAKHAGFHARPRDLGDCLIRAVAERLNCDVDSADSDLPLQYGRTRVRRP